MQATVDLRRPALGRSEQDECLIDEMSAQVIEDSSACADLSARLPRVLRMRLPPLKIRLEAEDVAELAVGDESPDREEVGIPTPVLKDRELAPEVRKKGGK